MTTVISVHSYRGGTGKSNATANLGAQLAAGGARVAVVDTDIHSPGLHVLFGFSQDFDNTVNDFLWGRIPITAAAHDVTPVIAANVSVASGGALYLVPSSMRANSIARVLREGYDVATLNAGLRDLGRGLNLDYLLIDTHPGLHEETMLSITISDVLLILLRPDQQDFQGTALTVDLARRLNIPPLYLVVNMVPSGIDPADLRETLTQAHQAETLAMLPLREQLARNGSSSLYSLVAPQDPWSAQIRAIAARLQS